MADDVVPGTGNAQQTNLGAFTDAIYLLQPQVQTAAAGDGTEITSATIDRCDPRVALSAKVAIPAHVVQASGHSCVISKHIDHSDDGSSWTADYVDVDSETVTANNDGSAVNTDLGFDVDLSGAKEYIRVRVTPNFSASGVDTIAIGGSIVLGGYDTNPPAHLT